MDDITGRVALVTGGSRGLGKASVLALAEAGCSVAINYRKEEAKAAEVLKEIEALGVKGMLVQADVSDEKEVARMVAEVEAGLGRIEILVNNAGISKPKPMEEISLADWNEMITVNLTSTFIVTQAVVPAMRKNKWGRIINMASAAAQLGGMAGPHYSASKAGQIGLTHSYAYWLVKEGITCNAINPALVLSDMVVPSDRLTADRIPMKRFGKPEEVGGIVAMLARNAYMTGQCISPNGGMYFTH